MDPRADEYAHLPTLADAYDSRADRVAVVSRALGFSEPVGVVYRRSFPQPDIVRISVPDDEFTGAECDVDALARAARRAADG